MLVTAATGAYGCVAGPKGAGMTERERIDRETLLRRAVAAAGAVYVAPVLTSGGSAAEFPCGGQWCADLLPGGSCDPRDRGRKACRRSGGRGCTCRPDRRLGVCTCQQPDAACTQDPRCVPDPPCGVAQFCNDAQTCICFIPVPPVDSATDCVEFPSNFCSDYPPCNKANGDGCPPGMCCLDTCCPEGLCSAPCGNGAPPRVVRRAGSGPTLTL
jgi:hypothetical protein